MGVLTALGRLADLTEAQKGMVTVRQAQARGVPRRDLARMVQAGGCERTARGVYRVSGAPRPRLPDLLAAWLQLAPGIDLDQRTPRDGVVSHASATLVYEVGMLDPWRHEFIVSPPRRVRSRRDDVVVYAAALPGTDVRWVDGILVTTPCRTVADLCTVRADGEHLAGVVSDLLDKRLTTSDELAVALAPYADAYGSELVDGRRFLRHLLNLTAGAPG